MAFSFKWKLFSFEKMEFNDFETHCWLISGFMFNNFKSWYLLGKLKNEYNCDKQLKS